MVVQYSRKKKQKQKKTPREREGDSKAGSQERKCSSSSEGWEVHTAPPSCLCLLTQSCFLDKQAELKTWLSTFAFPNRLQSLKKRGGRTASQCSCCNSSLSTQ